MTLYILFDFLKTERLTYETNFFVTKNAASGPPSKLGLKEGSYINIRDLIGTLVTKTANDAATVIAENIAGSEEKFARLMTKKARKIGMLNTIFKNATGLPHFQQKTTARDMAILALALMGDHPKNYRFFSTKSYNYKGQSYKNLNRLLWTYNQKNNKERNGLYDAFAPPFSVALTISAMSIVILTMMRMKIATWLRSSTANTILSAVVRFQVI